MKLYSHPASPFARKCRVIAIELVVKLDIVNISPRGDAEYRRVNPLGKVPALILDDGSALFDSPVICEYLNQTGGGKFFPGMSIWRSDSGRWKALTLQALGDGVMDAAVACRGEKAQPEAKRNDDAIARYMTAILAGLDVLAKVKFADQPTIGEITAGCALGYLDFRYPEIDWRGTRPRLAEWFAKFSRYEGMQATMPVDLAPG